jgi:hypothetical protein
LTLTPVRAHLGALQLRRICAKEAMPKACTVRPRSFASTSALASMIRATSA